MRTCLRVHARRANTRLLRPWTVIIVWAVGTSRTSSAWGSGWAWVGAEWASDWVPNISHQVWTIFSNLREYWAVLSGFTRSTLHPAQKTIPTTGASNWTLLVFAWIASRTQGALHPSRIRVVTISALFGHRSCIIAVKSCRAGVTRCFTYEGWDCARSARNRLDRRRGALVASSAGLTGGLRCVFVLVVTRRTSSRWVVSSSPVLARNDGSAKAWTFVRPGACRAGPHLVTKAKETCSAFSWLGSDGSIVGGIHSRVRAVAANEADRTHCEYAELCSVVAIRDPRAVMRTLFRVLTRWTGSRHWAQGTILAGRTDRAGSRTKSRVKSEGARCWYNSVVVGGRTVVTYYILRVKNAKESGCLPGSQWRQTKGWLVAPALAVYRYWPAAQPVV